MAQSTTSETTTSNLIDGERVAMRDRVATPKKAQQRVVASRTPYDGHISAAVLFGPIEALLLAMTILFLPFLVPGYDAIRQTVSEIGEVGSPAQLPFALALIAVACCNFVFAIGLRRVARRMGASTVCAWLVGAMTITVFGVALFPFPHPLHGVFGLSELVGYQAPLALAIGWRGRSMRGLILFSSVMAFLQETSLVANLSVLDFHGAFYAFERPFYGLVQRSLFACWCVWCFGTGLWLWRNRARSDSENAVET